MKSFRLIGPLAALLLLLAACGAATGQVRTYYISADEVEWDYAPTNTNGMTGKPFGEKELAYTQTAPDRIGKKYKKLLYREYTDQSFRTLKPRTDQWAHLGLLGPVIRAEVGDTIKVVFRNTTTFPLSIHPHGLRYSPQNEGMGMGGTESPPSTPGLPPSSPGARPASSAPMAEMAGMSKASRGAVLGGQSYTYSWEVPERAGPGPGDGSSVVWLYHSHVDETAETNAGLVGPIIISGRGQARADGSPKDVDRELVVLFTIFNENKSLLLDKNLATYAGSPKAVKLNDEDFQESNLKHAMNGYIYANLPDLVVKRGEKVRWYLLALGSEQDLHSPHWHGNTVLAPGRLRTDVLELMPASMKTVDMVPESPGSWMFHCHVNDHLEAGMTAMYTVTE